MLSNFMQVLNSASDIYTKNHYFPNSKLFSTISLLQKQRLNPRNYSKQEIIMKIIVWATVLDMNMHEKFQSIKVSLVKPNVKSGSRRFIQNLFYKF
jgi:hypothetical protein